MVPAKACLHRSAFQFFSFSAFPILPSGLLLLPHTLTLLSKGPDEWYLIQTADGRDVRYWINFAGVLSFSEMPAGFDPSNNPRKIIS